MAKAPIPGQVKTRLIPSIGKARAANLYRAMLYKTANKMLSSRICPVQLWCHPHTDHPDFLTLGNAGITLLQQQGKNLGERMSHALSHSLKSFRAAAVIGCDCPLLNPDIIHKALSILTEDKLDAVIGPAEDGGYYLIGLTKSAPSLFKNVSWGSSQVLKQTRDKLQNLDWEWADLDLLWDLDRFDDLMRLNQLDPTILENCP